MKCLIIVSVTCLLAVTSAVPRIFGGQDVPDGKYPYQVSIRINESHNCGGSIINNYWILTAAHCVKGYQTSILSIMAGSNLREGGSTGQFYKAEYAVFHDKFNESWHTQDDIALIRVDRQIEFNDRIKPVDLPKVDIDQVGLKASFSGWGRIEHFVLPDKLQQIKLYIYDHSKCRKRFTKIPFVFGDGQLCTVNKVGEGVCMADSGGPLVVDGVQIGIDSWGSYACATGKPDVFTKVYFYLDWINEQIKKYESTI